MKRLPQHSQIFLRNPNLIKELIGHSTIKHQDTVYDIGAGSGVISSVLAGRCKTVISIEFEPRIAQTLRENMDNYPNVTVIEGDFLEMALPKTSYKVFSNIPFHLSSQIVRKLTESDTPPDATYLIVQKQFANKLLADHDGFTGQLGMMIGPEFAVRIRQRLKRTDFFPHPNVDTVLLEILRRPKPFIAHGEMPAYRKFIEGCFSDPKIFAKMPQNMIGLPPGTKPSYMKLSQWTALYSHQRMFR